MTGTHDGSPQSAARGAIGRTGSRNPQAWLSFALVTVTASSIDRPAMSRQNPQRPVGLVTPVLLFPCSQCGSLAGLLLSTKSGLPVMPKFGPLRLTEVLS
jgi:hypothetical protein